LDAKPKEASQPVDNTDESKTLGLAWKLNQGEWKLGNFFRQVFFGTGMSLPQGKVLATEGFG